MKKILVLFFWAILMCLTQSATLWDEKNSIYSSIANYNVGDTLKIIFNEDSLIQYRASSSSSQKLSTSGLKSSGSFIDFLPPAGGNDAYSTGSKASTKSKKVIKNKITVQISKILNNGNIQISGQHNILINNQNETISITGIVNPKDIKNKKYVYSSDIINPAIVYRNYLVKDFNLTKKDIIQTYSTNISVVSGVTQRNITKQYSLKDKKKQELILQQLNKILSILFSK